MDDLEEESNPFKIIVFIVIGGLSIILTDIFILGDNRHLWDELKNRYYSESVEVKELRQQHAAYMTEGVDIENNVTSDPLVVAPRLSPSEIAFINIEEPPPMPEYAISPTNDAEQFADISPALGVDDDALDKISIISERENKPLIDEAPLPQRQKEITDIVSELAPESGEEEIMGGDDLDREISRIIEQELPEAKFVSASKQQDTITRQKTEFTTPQGKGLVAIIIDDMGVTLRSKQVEVMDGPLTLSYLPYSTNLSERTQRAKNNGHELMLHMPMEPMNGNLDGGPHVLTTTQDKSEFNKTLEWGLSSFDGFVGLNNHMGSRLTRDEKSMFMLMEYIKGKDLFFIDSKTIGSSVGAQMAEQVGIPYATRDVFIDHEITKEFIEGALKKLENVAHEKGHAIAIGHPHKETITALKKWLPTLKDKGLTLVPASQLVKYPADATVMASEEPYSQHN